MFKNNKKGNTLSTKRTNKSVSSSKHTQHLVGNDATLFDSLVNTSSTKQEKDDSLLIEDPFKIVTDEKNETYFFKFPNRKNHDDLAKTTIFSDTTIAIQDNRKSHDDLAKTDIYSDTTIAIQDNRKSHDDLAKTDIFSDTTIAIQDNRKSHDDLAKTDIFSDTTIAVQDNISGEKKYLSTINSCSKAESYVGFNDSSLFFKNDHKVKSEKACCEFPVRKDITAKSDTEFKEMSDTLDKSVFIPDASNVKQQSSSPIKKNLPEEIEGSDSDGVNQCPICLKTVTKYVNHMKSCAAKNKLSTQQLLSALRLHKKQLAERKELGLAIPAQSFRARVSPKRSRTTKIKGPLDSSLQLALALSASLHSAHEDEVILEAEALKEVGLCEEAEKKLSTLEKYGFAPALPSQSQTAIGGSKSRPQHSTLLLRRTREELERIVTEKVAIVLISEEENENLDSFKLKEPIVKSKVLKKEWDKETNLWGKASCSENEEREAFYVKSLSQFLSPSKADVGEGLRRLSQLPGRLNTPVKEDIYSLPTPDKLLTETVEADISDIPTPLRSEVCMRKKETNYIIAEKFQSNLCKDWRLLVNNSMLSDIKIHCKHFLVLPAHKLVFYARCPRILNEIVKQSTSGEVLLWESFSVSSVLTFLEFLYCGRADKIFTLCSEDFQSLNEIAIRYDFTDLKNLLNRIQKMHTNELNKADIRKELFKTNCVSDIGSNIVENLDDDLEKRFLNDSTKEESDSNSKNISRSQTVHSGSGFSSTSDGRESPDMFEDSNASDNRTESQQNRDDLDILVSLMGKTTQGESNQKFESSEKNKIILLDSPTTSCESVNFTSRKRKSAKRNLSYDEDEDVSLSKKYCSDLSRSANTENKNTDDTFDLTQSSDSSNEDNKSNNENIVRAINIPNESDKDESLVDLTQKHPEEFSPNSTKISKTGSEEYVGYFHDNIDYNSDTPNKSQVNIFEAKSVNKTNSPATSSSRKYDVIKNSSNHNFSISKLSPTLSQISLNQSERKNKKFSQDFNAMSQRGFEDNVQDYIDPVWEGYDDYFQINYESNISKLKTPLKLQEDESCSKQNLPSSSSFKESRTKDFSSSPKSSPKNVFSYIKSPKSLSLTTLTSSPKSSKSIKCISSDSESPKVSSVASNSPFKSSPIINYISSDSKSPKSFSQTNLQDSSPNSNHNFKSRKDSSLNNDPDVEFASEKCSSGSFVSNKSRKNLSSQFDINSDSPTNIDLELKRSSPLKIPLQEEVTQLTYQNSSEHLPKSSLRKDSLAAMQRLLDDSFEVNDSLLAHADALLVSKVNSNTIDKIQAAENYKSSSIQSQSKATNSSSKKSLMTPSPGIIVSDNVTPLPDYSAMKTPTLKKELTRFGLKPSLGRRKAKLLLRYIYDQTHPLLPDGEEQNNTQINVERKKDKINQTDIFKQPDGHAPRSPTKSPKKTQVTINLEDSESDMGESCSQKSTSSSVSSSVSLPEESYREAEDILSQHLSNSGDVRSHIRSMIVSDPEFHRKVLMYESIQLEDLMTELKANGIRSKANDVMDFLDEQCITFRTNSWKATNEKRRQKQKSPKKRSKIDKAGTSNNSLLRIDSQVIKKRGRPKKTDKKSK